VKKLLTSLKTGIDQDTNGQKDEGVIDKVLFNAIDLLIDDKVAKSNTKTKRSALERFKTEFAKQSKDSKDLDESWKKKIEESLEALITEADLKTSVGDFFTKLTDPNEINNLAIHSNSLFGSQLVGKMDTATWRFDREGMNSFKREIEAKTGLNGKPQEVTEALKKKIESVLAVDTLMDEGETLDKFDMKDSIVKEALKIYPGDKLEALKNFQMVVSTVKSNNLDPGGGFVPHGLCAAAFSQGGGGEPQNLDQGGRGQIGRERAAHRDRRSGRWPGETCHRKKSKNACSPECSQAAGAGEFPGSAIQARQRGRRGRNRVYRADEATDRRGA
jgi:hypothetical protein